MKKPFLAAVATLGVVAGFTALTSEHSHAADKPTVPANATLSFIRLYTGPDGVSHFVNEKMQLNAQGTEGMEARSR